MAAAAACRVVLLFGCCVCALQRLITQQVFVFVGLIKVLVLLLLEQTHISTGCRQHAYVCVFVCVSLHVCVCMRFGRAHKQLSACVCCARLAVSALKAAAFLHSSDDRKQLSLLKWRLNDENMFNEKKLEPYIIIYTGMFFSILSIKHLKIFFVIKKG